MVQQYYLRARNYNPLVGRFTQEDVYRGDGLNLYVYCGNNPVMYVDPSGYYKATDEVFDESSVGKKSRSQDLKAAMISDMTGMPYSDAKGVATGSHQAQQNSKLRKAHQDGIDLYLRNDYNTNTKDYYAGGKNKEQAQAKYEEDNFGDKCSKK